MDELYDIPLQAVRAFEKATGLYITIHDLSGRLHDFLPPEYFSHRTPGCLAVKARQQERCSEFDMDRTRAALQDCPQGRTHVCHAGFVECVVPGWRDDRLAWVIFAGQCRPGAGIATASPPAPSRRPPPWAKQLARLPALSADEAAVSLELLRQLAARLEHWRRELENSAAVPPPGARPGLRATDMTTRGALIRRFIQSRHTEPLALADLAAYLHISESRAGHAVRQACGRSFIELLLEARLKTAEALLRHSNLSVLEVAARSGFGDLSHFHACFRKRFAATPHRYRRHVEADAPGGFPV